MAADSESPLPQNIDFFCRFSDKGVCGMKDFRKSNCNSISVSNAEIVFNMKTRF